jgi:hypothetical protein
VDILLPIVPSQEEVTKLRDHAAQHGGSYELLTPEDQFLAELVGIERLTQKLLLMKFMGEFEDRWAAFEFYGTQKFHFPYKLQRQTADSGASIFFSSFS